eukprot:CAMPEP_0201915382 /NCGR_PEP_ID=MMETSP0903-20130614/5310_1 /ASSEMBLY_ACC=CAM_ASM_000552 /TAXON_ID=420261 /ORGANISM="Thalassiosira antarctica, Strain CCMP982" /LENGTH=305 /DNA_ID=CAMNT_0048450971 /DNA_START=176 /DNA_END=1093 /DNA_ORIENTATION=+
MPKQQNRERLESLRRRKNRSVLQMIQTLEMCSTFENDEASPLRPSKKPCLTFHRSTDLQSSLFIMPDDITCNNIKDESDCCNDDGTFVTAASSCPDSPSSEDDTFAVGNKPFEIGIVTSPGEERPRITSRRQRRGKDKTSCYDSDFCNNDLARQIEAMVLEAETAFENRHVTKSSVAQLLSTECSIIKEAEQARSNDKTLESTKNSLFSITAKNTLQVDTLETNKDNLPSTPNWYPLQLLHRTFQTQTQQKHDDVPSMTKSDSLVSVSSDHSTSARSSSDLLNLTPTKKARKMSPQPNAEWAIIE